MRKKTIFLPVFVLFLLAACSSGAAVSDSNEPVFQASGESADVADTQQSIEAADISMTVEYDSNDLGADINSAGMTTISLNGDVINIDGSGVEVDNRIVKIVAAGTYNIEGHLYDGQIMVDTEDAEAVVLVLNGVNITNTTGAPLYVSNAEKTVITLAPGTENYVTDGTAYQFEDGSDEPDAAIFSHDDLTLNGSGSLTVQANYNNGIASKDVLKITGGQITVNAINDGIKGRDALVIKEGVIAVIAGGDGLQSNNDEDPTQGYILIEGGSLNITARLDGIQAETGLQIDGGDFTIISGGGSQQINSAGDSVKGLKAGVTLIINGGTFLIDSLDDAIHSNNSITINGGIFDLATADDGIHSDSILEINGGELNISRSYEGIESSVITINDGTIHVFSSDDGINASSGTAGDTAAGPPMGGPGGFEEGDNYLYVNGGYLFVDAWGDGLDINGPISMTGGVVIVNGPVTNNNGALDYAGEFKITYGFLVAVGSAGMAQAPSTTSTQYSVMHTFTAMQSAGTLVHIQDENGEDILTFIPTKDYQSIVISSPALQNGATYYVYTGGSASGTVVDGLYSSGTYTAGTQVASFTISNIVTGANNMGRGPGGDVPRPPRP